MLEGCVPWPADVAARYRRQGWWQGITIAQLLERTAARLPDKTALVSGDLRLSYAALVAGSRRLACGFLDAGIKAQDRVVLQLPNGPEFVFAYFALTCIGAIPVMALRAHRHSEVRHFLKASGATAYVIPDRIGSFDYHEMAREVGPEAPALRHVFVAGEPGAGQIDLRALLAAPLTEADVAARLAGHEPDLGEVTLMLLSGGTTSLSKLIPRTHEDYVLNARLCGRAGGFDEATVFMAILPLGHNYNLASPGMLGCFYYGGTVVLAPSGDAAAVFALVQREKVSVVAAVVPLISNWLNSPVPDNYDLSSLKVIQNGGARLAPELRGRMRERFGCLPQEIYGTAEGLINMVPLDAPDDMLLTSSGVPVCEDDEIKVVDDDGNEVPDGEPGERFVLCRSGARAEKERAMLQRQSERLTEELIKIDAGLRRTPQTDHETVGRRIGRHLGKYPAAAAIVVAEAIHDAEGRAIGLRISSRLDAGQRTHRQKRPGTATGFSS